MCAADSLARARRWRHYAAGSCVCVSRVSCASVCVCRFVENTCLCVGGGGGSRCYAVNSVYTAARQGVWVHHTTRVSALAWAPSGRLLATVSTDRRICLWDPATRKLSKKIERALHLAGAPQGEGGCVWSRDAGRPQLPTRTPSAVLRGRATACSGRPTSRASRSGGWWRREAPAMPPHRDAHSNVCWQA